MIPPARQEPPADAVAAITALGFERIADLDAHQALRWTATGGLVGILYASHLPTPWGVYWRAGAQGWLFVWSRQLESVLYVAQCIPE